MNISMSQSGSQACYWLCHWRGAQHLFDVHPATFQSAVWTCYDQSAGTNSLYIYYTWYNQITCQPEVSCQMWTWLQLAGSLFPKNEVEYFADGILDIPHSCETLHKLTWLISFLCILAEPDKRWNQNKNSWTWQAVKPEQEQPLQSNSSYQLMVMIKKVSRRTPTCCQRQYQTQISCICIAKQWSRSWTSGHDQI